MNPTKTNMRKLLTRAKVQAYFDSKPADSIAGDCGRPASCAISEYFMQALTLPEDSKVYSDHDVCFIMLMTEDPNGGEPSLKATTGIKSPRWVEKFMIGFDSGTGKQRDKDGLFQKTFGQAAEILRNL